MRQRIQRTLQKSCQNFYQRSFPFSSVHKKLFSPQCVQSSPEQVPNFLNGNYPLPSNGFDPSILCPPSPSQYFESLSLGISYLNKNDAKNAIQAFEIAYKLSLKVFGGASRNSAICLSYLAQSHQLEENLDQSMNLYFEALDILKEKKEFCAFVVSDIHHNLNTIYQRSGDLSKALDHGQTSLETLIKHAPQEYKRLCLVLQSLGKTYFLKGDLEESKDFFKRALEMLSNDKGKNDIERGLLYEKIGVLMEKEGNLKEAISFKKMTLEIQKKNATKVDDSIIFNQYLSIAALYYRCFEYKESLSYLEKAFRFHEKHMKKEKTHKGPLLIKIGELHIRLGNNHKAIEVLEDAIKIFEAETHGRSDMQKRARRMIHQAQNQIQHQMEEQIQEFPKSLEKIKQEAMNPEILLESWIPNNLKEAERLQSEGMKYLEKFDLENAKRFLVKALQGFSYLEGEGSKTYLELRNLIQSLNRGDI